MIRINNYQLYEDNWLIVFLLIIKIILMIIIFIIHFTRLIHRLFSYVWFSKRIITSIQWIIKTHNSSDIHLYANTVLDGTVRLWFCPFAIETTFPLSNFKTKHIFGILMERVTFLKPSWRPVRGAPNMGCPWRPKFFSIFFIAAEGGVSWRPKYGAPQFIFNNCLFFHRRWNRRLPKWVPHVP